jgi:hypothetical protein
MTTCQLLVLLLAAAVAVAVTDISIKSSIKNCSELGYLLDGVFAIVRTPYGMMMKVAHSNWEYRNNIVGICCWG